MHAYAMHVTRAVGMRASRAVFSAAKSVRALAAGAAAAALALAAALASFSCRASSSRRENRAALVRASTLARRGRCGAPSVVYLAFVLLQRHQPHVSAVGLHPHPRHQART